MIEEGTVILATGEHTPADCGIEGHCAYDGKTHALASCGIEGHCISDGRDHNICKEEIAA